MRGLARLRERYGSIPPAEFDIGNYVPMRRVCDPIRTESEAWRDLLTNRYRTGVPVSIDEIKEASEASKRALA